MPDKIVFVYRLKGSDFRSEETNANEMKINKWRPGVLSFIPPNSPASYLFLWLMHILKIFKNGDYSAYSIVENENNVCSLVCVPSLYKWPFMGGNDLQIKNVFTLESYRGKGYATKLINFVLQAFPNRDDRIFWYMTDEHNIPSQKLCEKIGFEYMGKYRRKRNKFFLYEGEIYTDK
jgi:RimJ/RimL family protein N-acetyltransferase